VSCRQNASSDILFTKNRIRASLHKSPEPAPPVNPPTARRKTERRNFLFESVVTY
jgi:hypothetical protein